MSPILFPEDIKAIVRGDHGDPFAVLGPHQVGVGTGTAVAVRVFLPGVRQASVVPVDLPDDGEPMELLHTDGFFETVFLGRRHLFAYRLRVVDGQGQTLEVEDPYRFPPALSEYDLYLMGEGTHLRNYEKLGAHAMKLEGVAGVNFSVWAPNAKRVSVVGDFNHWDGRCHPMRNHPGNGIWEIFIPGLREGALYKFEVKARSGEEIALKADPYACAFESAPRTA